MFTEMKEPQHAKSNKIVPLRSMTSQLHFKEASYVNDLASDTYALQTQFIKMDKLNRQNSIWLFRVIHPDKTFRIAVEFISMLIIIGQTVEIPMMIGLDNMPIPPAYDNYQTFIDWYFWAVMALQFNIAIYEKGILI